jgi:predicted nucleotidyltransferase
MMNAEDVDHRVREVVVRIVSAFSPSMVLLFGSRARGDARPDSDVDLIVVWKDENPPPKRSAAARLALGHVGFPMDLAVVTPSEFARFREWRGHVFHSAAREGVVLHAA